VPVNYLYRIFHITPWLHTVTIKNWRFSNAHNFVKNLVRHSFYILNFEAFEQTLRLRLVSGPVDKKIFFISRNSLSRTRTVLPKFGRFYAFSHHFPAPDLRGMHVACVGVAVGAWNRWKRAEVRKTTADARAHRPAASSLPPPRLHIGSRQLQ
jgi:hypothetical protein